MNCEANNFHYSLLTTNFLDLTLTFQHTSSMCIRKGSDEHLTPHYDAQLAGCELKCVWNSILFSLHAVYDLTVFNWEHCDKKKE